MRFNRVLIVVGIVAFGAEAIAQTNSAYKPGPGIVNPTELKFVEPEYTQAARDAGIEGMVVLEAVIDTSGKVVNTRVVKSLDPKYGLDDQAVAAAKQWTFHPATKDGTPVPII